MAYKKKSAYATKRRRKPGLWTKLKERLADLFRRENKTPIGVAGMRPAQRRNLGVTPARLGAAFACMMLGLVVWAGYQFASHWTLFHLNANEIKLIGAHTLTERQVLALAGLADRPEPGRAPSTLSLDTDAIEARLTAHPRIASATVKKRWPSGLLVEVEEYAPFALVNLAAAGGEPGVLCHIDRSGHVIGEVPEGGDLDYPVIGGLTEADVEANRLGERARGALQVLRLAARGNAILPMRSVSEVLVGDEGEVELLLADHPFPIRFGKENLQAKFNDLLRILKKLYDSGEIGQVASLEMGYGDNRNKMLCRWAQAR